MVLEETKCGARQFAELSGADTTLIMCVVI